jgi:pimeloyl-ACP methyl ester carboxylesterase
MLQGTTHIRGVFLVVLWALVPGGCFLSRLYSTPWPQPIEVVKVRTSDGWTLDLRHVSPERPNPQRRPVVLVHGIIANGRNMDLDGEHSLARALARRGFDVWIPSLRNVGASEHRWLPGLAAAESDFDAYVTRDLPALLAEVHARTGAKVVDYVGHSMGGLILYAYLARGGSDIGRAVALGSPVRLRWTGNLESFARGAQSLGPMGSWLPVQSVAHTTSPVQGEWDTLEERLLISPENTTLATWKKLVADSVDDVPSGLLSQFVDWVGHDRFDSADHSIDYLRGLRNVRTPLLVVAGKTDGLAPPWTVRPAFDELGSPEKEWVVLGEANGQSADYNHMDMLLGEQADRDVFEPVASFLSR